MSSRPVGDNQELRHRVEALLNGNAAPGSFFDAELLSTVTGDFIPSVRSR